MNHTAFEHILRIVAVAFTVYVIIRKFKDMQSTVRADTSVYVYIPAYVISNILKQNFLRFPFFFWSANWYHFLFPHNPRRYPNNPFPVRNTRSNHSCIPTRRYRLCGGICTFRNTVSYHTSGKSIFTTIALTHGRLLYSLSTTSSGCSQ